MDSWIGCDWLRLGELPIWDISGGWSDEKQVGWNFPDVKLDDPADDWDNDCDDEDGDDEALGWPDKIDESEYTSIDEDPLW